VLIGSALCWGWGTSPSLRVAFEMPVGASSVTYLSSIFYLSRFFVVSVLLHVYFFPFPLFLGFPSGAVV
jgi:hypothetical protein